MSDGSVPGWNEAAYHSLGVALQAHADSLMRVRTALDGVIDRASRISQTLDACDVQLANTVRRLECTATVLGTAQRLGPRGALDDVIDILRSERLDARKSPRADEYETLLARAIEVREEIRSGRI